jgi:ribosomal protein S18 acetylase RimI-like enzyme
MWTVRLMAPGEQGRVGEILGAAFAGKYGPALGDDPTLAAGIAAVLPPGGLCYVGEQAGALQGAGLLRVAGQPTYGPGETMAIWRLLRQRQSLGRAISSVLLLSLVGSDHDPDRTTGYVSSLAVDPAAQGRGLGTALLTHLETVARDMGKTRLALHVVDSNTGARRLYERHGFRVVRAEPAFFTRRRWGYRAVLFMIKPLW